MLWGWKPAEHFESFEEGGGGTISRQGPSSVEAGSLVLLVSRSTRRRMWRASKIVMSNWFGTSRPSYSRSAPGDLGARYPVADCDAGGSHCGRCRTVGRGVESGGDRLAFQPGEHSVEGCVADIDGMLACGAVVQQALEPRSERLRGLLARSQDLFGDIMERKEIRFEPKDDVVGGLHG